MEEASRQALLAEVRRDLADAEEYVADLRRIETYLVSKGPPPVVPRSLPNTRLPSIVENLEIDHQPGMTYADIAQVILGAVGAPVRTQDMIDVMERSGIEVVDKNRAVNTMYTALIRAPEIFARIDKGTWVLKSWQTNGARRSQIAGTLEPSSDDEDDIPF